MSIRLYGFPGTRTSRVAWLLEELELAYEYETIAVGQGEHRSEAHRARPPHGVVPVLEDGALRLLESSAMVLYLADKAGKLAPAVGTPERGRYYQHVVYAAATLDGPAVEYFFHTVLLPEARRDPERAKKAKSSLDTAIGVLEQALGDGPYLLGAEFSAADVAVGYDLHLMRAAGLCETGPLRAYADRLAERPAHRKTFAPG